MNNYIVIAALVLSVALMRAGAPNCKSLEKKSGFTGRMCGYTVNLGTMLATIGAIVLTFRTMTA